MHYKIWVTQTQKLVKMSHDSVETDQVIHKQFRSKITRQMLDQMNSKSLVNCVGDCLEYSVVAV